MFYAIHCVKSVRIWSYPGPYFPVFGYRETLSISPYSVRMRENTDQKWLCPKFFALTSKNLVVFFKWSLRNIFLIFILKISPNGHIFVDSPSIRRRNSTWKVCRDFIDFERRIHLEIMTSIRRGNFRVDSTFKIDEISMSSQREFFYVVSTSNWHNFRTHCLHSIIS